MTVSDAILSAPTPYITTDTNRILSTELMKIAQGDIVLLSVKNVDPSLFGIHAVVEIANSEQSTENPVEIIYINGNKSLESISRLAQRLNDNREIQGLKIVCEDSIPSEWDLDLNNTVWQQRLIEYVENAKVPPVFFFDATASLIKGKLDEDAERNLRKSIIRLRQLHVTQIWLLTHEQNKMKFPLEVGTTVCNLSADPDPETQTLTLEIIRNGNDPSQPSKSVALQVIETAEEGLTIVNREMDKNDRLTAMVLVDKGKSQTDIAEALGYNQSTVHHWFKRFKKQGLMTQSGNTYSLTDYDQSYLEGKKD
jgi:hypothetical protein